MARPTTKTRPVPRRRTRSAFRGCLLGGAIGDALGAPVEFAKLPEIRRRFGPKGVIDFAPAYGRVGAITDDTQMTLFTAEGLIRAHNRWLGKGIASVEAAVWYAYRRWFRTQRPLPREDGEPPFELRWPGWLVQVKGLHHERAPGNTCLASLEADRMPHNGESLNDSKGCGGVMRIAPVGLVAEEAFELGGKLAGLTHGHPTGRLAAACLAEVVSRLVAGADLRQAVEGALRALPRVKDHQETSNAVRSALALADAGPPSAAKVESLGGGWVAEEALAIGLYCALAAKDYAHGVLLAVNHSGDSDSTGSIAGNLLGLLHGEEGIPKRWREKVELAEVVTTVADDLFNAFVEPGDWEGYEWERYPGC
ncbi:MAG: ADP-ribosylglycohydrolase family protein [Anaeromyxobacteraceae bacterium]|nr:ADP-ribosylglycohydrolase family protein [Anaeromyxobacteraceae bacterium]